MSLNNFGLLVSTWGKNATICRVEFHEVRKGDRNSWQAIAVTENGQMYFSNNKGDPRCWATLDRAVGELSRVVPPLAELIIICIGAKRHRALRNQGDRLGN